MVTVPLPEPEDAGRFGTIRSCTDPVSPPSVAWIQASVGFETSCVSIVNVPLLFPWAIVIDEGTIASTLSLVSRTTAPPVGAADLIVTVAVAVSPPSGCIGSTVSTSGVLVVNRIHAGMLEPPAVAVIRMRISLGTSFEVMANVPLERPSATTIDDGTVAAVSSAASATVRPPAGAGVPSVTVPLDASPPLNTEGFIDSEASAAVASMSNAPNGNVPSPLGDVGVDSSLRPQVTAATITSRTETRRRVWRTGGIPLTFMCKGNEKYLKAEQFVNIPRVPDTKNGRK